MKQIVVISGKGGTGKTSITASLAAVGASEIIAADCDVDAADMHLITKPTLENEEEFYSGSFAVIDKNACINCGKCLIACHFNAIERNEDGLEVRSFHCEGCSYCHAICPANAISMKPALTGTMWQSRTRQGFQLVHARLKIGAENSGKLVTKVKDTARMLAENAKKNYVLIDGSPGVGCPVISSLSGADLVLFVTEPSISGLADFTRVLSVVKQFKIPAVSIINKSDLNYENAEKMREIMQKNEIEILDEFKYDKRFSEALSEAQTLVEFDEEMKEKFTHIWTHLKKII